MTAAELFDPDDGPIDDVDKFTSPGPRVSLDQQDDRAWFMDRVLGRDRGVLIAAFFRRPYRSEAGAYEHDDRRDHTVPFAWPDERAQFLREVDRQVALGADAYACMALRVPGATRRALYEAVGPRVIWADLDGEFDEDAVTRLRAIVVGSGTDGHRHAYVPLAEPVDPLTFRRLAVAVRDLLSADTKISDNDLLRIVGTFNFKPTVPCEGDEPGEPAPVGLLDRGGAGWHVGDLAHELGVDLNAPAPRAALGGLEPVAPAASLPDPMPEKVQRALSGPVGDRSSAHHRLVGAAYDSGLSRAQAHALTASYLPSTAKYRGRVAEHTDASWLKVAEAAAGRAAVVSVWLAEHDEDTEGAPEMAQRLADDEHGGMCSTVITSTSTAIADVQAGVADAAVEGARKLVWATSAGHAGAALGLLALRSEVAAAAEAAGMSTTEAETHAADLIGRGLGLRESATLTETEDITPCRCRGAALIRAARVGGELAPGEGEGDDDGPEPGIPAARPGRAAPVPNPATPMPVARHFLAENPGLKFWRDEWLRYTDTHWEPLPTKALRSRVGLRFEHAHYEVRTENGPRRMSFNPTPKKLSMIIDAMEAITWDNTDLNTWTSAGDHPAGPRPIAVTNGLINIDTGELHPHDPAWLCLHHVPVVYRPDATCTRWLDFLGEILDEQSILLLQMWFGYVLSGRTNLQKALMMTGAKRGGKGIIAAVLTALCGGRDHVAGPTMSAFGSNFGLAGLIGKPLAIIGDARGGRADERAAAVERILAITGEDSVQIDRKNRDHWNGRLPTRIMLLSNELPDLPDASGALGRRWLHLRFATSFLGREDFTLESKLLAELDGILLWALEGYRLLVAAGGRFPAVNADVADEYVESGSPVSVFVADHCCVIEPAGNGRVDKAALFSRWKEWAASNGHRVGNAGQFSIALQAVVPHLGHDNVARPRQYVGVTLRKRAQSATRSSDARHPCGGEHL